MNHARKMVLVPEQTLERLQQKRHVNTTPLTDRLTSLDHDMQNDLKSDELTDEEKVRHHIQTLQNYLTYYNKRKTEPFTVHLQSKEKRSEPATESTSKEKKDDEDKEEDKVEQEILRSLPKALKQRGQLLINKIKENPEVMKWDSRGQLVFQDQPVSGTHVVDLVGDFLRARKGFDPVGWETFAQGLAKMNTPEDLVRNQARRIALRDFKSNPYRAAEESPTLSFLNSPSTAGPVRVNTRKSRKQKRQGQRWLNFNA